MKTPIPLPVRAVKLTKTSDHEWTADVTFGTPDPCHDDPTITVDSSGPLGRPPRAGDVLMVRPPEILYFANAGGMARELAAQDSDNSNDING